MLIRGFIKIFFNDLTFHLYILRSIEPIQVSMERKLKYLSNDRTKLVEDA